VPSRVLDDGLGIGHQCGDGVAAVSDDRHDALDPGAEDGVDDPADERHAKDLVRHLRQRGAHTGAFSGGENDGNGLHRCGSSITGSIVRAVG